MNPTERASHPSRNQIEVLIEFLEKYPNLAKGFSKVPSARDESRKAWEGLSFKLNSLGGSVKTWKQWTKYWADKKSAVKKKVSLRYRTRNKTGGGFESVVELSDVEERIVAVMGGESFSIGDRNLAINPFPEPSSPSLLSADNNAIPLLTREQQHESSTASLIDLDAFTPTTETPLREFQLECIAGTSHSSARPSVVHMVIPNTREVQTPPRIRSPSPLQPQTPSGSGKYPGRRRLDLSGLQAHTTSSVHQRPVSSVHQRPRHLRRSPPSQRQGQFLNIMDRLIKLEEQRIELDRCNAERQAELDRCNAERQAESNLATARALNAMGEGIQMLAEAINKKI